MLWLGGERWLLWRFPRSSCVRTDISCRNVVRWRVSPFVTANCIGVWWYMTLWSLLMLLKTTQAIRTLSIPFPSSHLHTGKADLTLHIITPKLQLPNIPRTKRTTTPLPQPRSTTCSASASPLPAEPGNWIRDMAISRLSNLKR